MSYADLQDRAKVLGLKYVGVSEKDLEKAIKKAEASLPTESPESESPEPETSKNANVAIVYDAGGHEVRKYTKGTHGKGFAKLAEDFVVDREDYKFKLVEAKPQIKCPGCGQMIDA